MSLKHESIELLSAGATYFDTSSWNGLAKHRDRDEPVHLIQQRKQVVVASVISVAEVLRIKDSEQRRLICSTMHVLHGDRPLFRTSARPRKSSRPGILQREEDYRISPSGPGSSLYSLMVDPISVPATGIWDWLHNMDQNVNRFIDQIRPSKPDLETKYHSPEIIEGHDFFDILCSFPPAKGLGLSISQMRELCTNSDIWRALGATLAYIVNLSTTHSPKNKKGKKRPGGPDLWQSVYLGAVEVFVTTDTRLLEAVSEISRLLKYPRCAVDTDTFLSGVLGMKEGLNQAHTCVTCGCGLPTKMGMHGIPLSA
jgi:hypothetical protein